MYNRAGVYQHPPNRNSSLKMEWVDVQRNKKRKCLKTKWTLDKLNYPKAEILMMDGGVSPVIFNWYARYKITKLGLKFILVILYLVYIHNLIYNLNLCVVFDVNKEGI